MIKTSIILRLNSISRASPLQNCFNHAFTSSSVNLIPRAIFSFATSTSISAFDASSSSIRSYIRCRATFGASASVSTRLFSSFSIFLIARSFSFIGPLPNSFSYSATTRAAIISIRSALNTYSKVCSTTYHSMKSFFSFSLLQVCFFFLLLHE